MTPPTSLQIKRLYTIAGTAGLDTAGVHAEISDRYGVESTRDLEPRWYEAYCRDLERRSRQRRAQADRSTADQAMHHPRCIDLEGCRATLLRTWPQLAAGYPDLAIDAAEALDCFRLVRKAGSISPRLLVVIIQKMQKVPINILGKALEAYLSRYTTRDENYFLAICRRMKRDAEREQLADSRQAKVEQRKAAAVDNRIKQILIEAGEIPSLAAAAPSATCHCQSGKLFWRLSEGAWKDVPCPWCTDGLALWRHLLNAGRAPTRIPWALIREQIEEATP